MSVMKVVGGGDGDGGEGGCLAISNHSSSHVPLAVFCCFYKMLTSTQHQKSTTMHAYMYCLSSKISESQRMWKQNKTEHKHHFCTVHNT